MDNEILHKSLFAEAQPRADRIKLESPIEELLIQSLEKYLSPQTQILPQYEIMTLAGKFRLDFLLTVGDKKIAIECDGKDFHDEWRDEWRDALILGTSEIDTIYRFRGKDIFTFLDDCIYLIYHYDKELFSDRYPILAARLISDSLKHKLDMEPAFRHETNTIEYEITNEDDDIVKWKRVITERRNKDDYAGHWNILFDIAKKNPGLNLDQLMEIRRKEMDAVFKQQG